MLAEAGNNRVAITYVFEAYISDCPPKTLQSRPLILPLVTHEANEYNICQRRVSIRNGRLRKTGRVSNNLMANGNGGRVHLGLGSRTPPFCPAGALYQRKYSITFHWAFQVAPSQRKTSSSSPLCSHQRQLSECSQSIVPWSHKVHDPIFDSLVGVHTTIHHPHRQLVHRPKVRSPGHVARRRCEPMRSRRS